MVQTTAENIKIVKQLKKKFSKLINLERLILFGSRAKGNFNEYSDFDLAIISDDFKNISLHKRAVKFYLSWDYDYPIEFLCYTTEEFKKYKTSPIISEIIKTGIII